MVLVPRTLLPALLTSAFLLGGVGLAHAETVIQQCGQQYQAAKAAGTLNGMTWNQFRSDCSAKLKAQPASVTTTTPAATPAANPLKPTPAPAPVAPAPAPAPATTTAAVPAPTTPVPAPATTAEPGKTPMTAGRTAFYARERECGTEWKANKTTLVAQTPGLTWPKYLSSCNARLKAAGK